MSVALFSQASAPPETAQTRKEITAFILSVNPKFPDADRASNQLLYAESVGGADAKWMAALVAQERRWQLKANPPYDKNNLVQITLGTARMVYGKPRADSWELNLLWGSWYLKSCLRAEKGDMDKALRRYNGGPSKPPITLQYLRAVKYYRRKLP
jgi:hypothetical protein